MVLWNASNVPAGINSWNGVAYGNSTFVVVGLNIMISTDNGNNWSLIPIPQDFTPKKGWQCVTFGGGFFLAISGNNVMKSSDGTNWSYISNAPNYSWKSVSYFNDIYVAVCDGNTKERIMTSTDGINWSLSNNSKTNTNLWYGSAVGNGKIVVVGMNNKENTNIIYSTNGSDWNSTIIKTPTANIALNAITFGDGKFVALANNYACSSTDGINWTLTALPSSQKRDWRSLVYCNGSYVAVCTYSGKTDRCMVSSDGKTWNLIQTPENKWCAVTTGNDYLVSVSLDGKAMVSNSIDAPTLGAFNISRKKYRDSSFTITAPSSNSNGSFSYRSENPNVASLSGSKITIVGVGSSIITATQAATASFTSATTSTIFIVGKAITTLGAFSIPAQFYGDNTFTLTNPSTNSDQPFTYSSSNASVATVSGNKVTIKGIGSSTITVSQDENPRYTYASASQAFIVSNGVTTIGTFSIPSKTYGDNPFVLKNPNSNNTNGSFTYTSSDSSIASIIGNQITINKAGTITITATQAANNFFNSATKTATFKVNKADPTLGSFTIQEKTYGSVTNVSITDPTSNSSGSFSYTSSDTSVASIIGNQITIKKAGTTTITATQLESINYASSVKSTTFKVKKADHTIGSLSLPIDKIYEKEGTFTISQPSSMSPGNFNYTSSDTSVVTINGTTDTVTIVGAGTTTITATQAESTNYNSSSTSGSITILKANPSLVGSLPSLLPSTVNYGVEPISINNPTSNSTGNFIYTSSDPSVAYFETGTSYNKLTILKSGQTTITVKQEETSNFKEFVGTITTLTVQKAIPTINAFSIPQKTLGEDEFTQNAPITNSDGALTYTSSNPDVATITGNTIKILAIGTTTITARFAESDKFNSSEITSQFVVVAKVDATLNNFIIPSKMCGDVPFTITPPVSNSAGVFSYTSSISDVATINGNTITLRAVGTTTITAVQAETPKYYSSSISTVLTVNKGTPVFGPFSIPAKVKTSQPFTITPPSSTNPASFTFTSSNTAVASIETYGNIITINSAGTTTITATQAANSNFNTASTTAVFEVSEGLPFEQIGLEAARNMGWSSLAYGNGLFVAVARSGNKRSTPNNDNGKRVMTSPDGVTWTGRETAPYIANYEDADWSSVAYGNGLFVAVSEKWSHQDTYPITSMTSTNGTNWTLSYTTDLGSLGNFLWTSVAYGNGLFVAVSTGNIITGPSNTRYGVIGTSSNGVNWTQTFVSHIAGLSRVTYGNGLFVAFSANQNVFLTSSDGLTWTSRTLPNIKCCKSVDYVNESFLAIVETTSNSANAIMKSLDGINWTIQSNIFSADWKSISYGGGYYVAFNNSAGKTKFTAMYSQDGITWESTAQNFAGYVDSAYGNGVFVGVSTKNNIVRIATN